MRGNKPNDRSKGKGKRKPEEEETWHSYLLQGFFFQGSACWYYAGRAGAKAAFPPPWSGWDGDAKQWIEGGRPNVVISIHVWSRVKYTRINPFNVHQLLKIETNQENQD